MIHSTNQPPLPTPKITSLTPSTSVAGGGFTLMIDGVFVAVCIVNFGWLIADNHIH